MCQQKMTSHFIEQVQILMHNQQTKYSEKVFGGSNYTWLASRRPCVVWMSTKDEYKIRRALNKVNEEQTLKVMKQLVTWLEEHPNVSSLKVPEMCIQLLSRMETANILNNSIIYSRTNSLRNSLRRFSSFRNKVSPTLGIPVSQNPRRSVTFNDEPIIYLINMKDAK